MRQRQNLLLAYVLLTSLSEMGNYTGCRNCYEKWPCVALTLVTILLMCLLIGREDMNLVNEARLYISTTTCRSGPSLSWIEGQA